MFSQSDRINLPGTRMMKKRYSPILKEEVVEGCTDGTVGLSPHLMTPFHGTTGREMRFNCIVRTRRVNIRTFVRPGLVGRTVPPSVSPPCHHTGTETEGRAGTIPCIDSFVPIFFTSLRIISPCAQY